MFFLKSIATLCKIMLKPFVSICIPVYNRPELIKRALDSCINQTYKNIEIVVVDDASTDITPEVVKSYSAKDMRVKFYRNEKNLGMVPNWLRTFELSSGDYVQHLGSDDQLSKNFVEEKVKIFQKYPDAAFVGCGIRTYKEDSSGNLNVWSETKYPKGRYETTYIFKNFYKKPALVCTACTVRRSDMLENFKPSIPNKWGYNDAYTKGGKIMDVLVFLKILRNYKFMYYLDNVFYESLEHPGNATKLFFGLTKGRIPDHIKFSHMDQVGFSYFYKNYAPKYLSRFRVFVGSNILAGTFLDLLFKRASGSPRQALKDFFSEYSPKERFFAFIIFPIRVIKRIMEWVLRKTIFKSQYFFKT